MGLAHLGKGLPWKKLRRECPGLSFLVPQIYLEDIADKQRLSEIDLEMELELARYSGVTGRD